MENRERARASDQKQRRQILCEEKHENFIAAVRQGEMLVANKEPLKKKKVNRNTGNKIFGEHKQ